MKKPEILNSIWAAFAAYSRLPVPEASRDEGSLRWQICCFPLVGLVNGLIWCGAAILMTGLQLHPVLIGAVLTVLPLFLTGGIHMDGFLDTSDAIHSWKSPEERLAILKDPRIGAFAFIYGAVYLLLWFGLAVQIAAEASEAGAGISRIPFFMTGAAFVLSRIFSAISVLWFPKAKRDGMLRSTADAADRRAKYVILIELAVMVLICLAGAVYLKRFETALLPGISALVCMYYYRMAREKFGGTSGDLAGWFLQVSELVLLGVSALSAILR